MNIQTHRLTLALRRGPTGCFEYGGHQKDQPCSTQRRPMLRTSGVSDNIWHHKRLSRSTEADATSAQLVRRRYGNANATKGLPVGAAAMGAESFVASPAYAAGSRVLSRPPACGTPAAVASSSTRSSPSTRTATSSSPRRSVRRATRLGLSCGLSATTRCCSRRRHAIRPRSSTTRTRPTCRRRRSSACSPARSSRRRCVTCRPTSPSRRCGLPRVTCRACRRRCAARRRRRRTRRRATPAGGCPASSASALSSVRRSGAGPSSCSVSRSTLPSCHGCRSCATPASSTPVYSVS